MILIHQKIFTQLNSKILKHVSLRNISKDWVKNFKILINDKKIKIKNYKEQGRKELTLINLKKLISSKNLESYYLNFELAHKYCDKINKLIKTHD